MFRPSSFAAVAVLVSWTCARILNDFSKLMSLAKSRLFSCFAICGPARVCHDPGDQPSPAFVNR